MSNTDQEINISDEMFSYMLKKYPYYSEKTLVGSLWYIGYHHLTHRYGERDKITRPTAKKLFISDIKDIENYYLVRQLKNKVRQNFYDVCINFTYEYGKKVLKNSKFYYYLKTQNIDKCIEELEKYKTYKNVFDPKITSRREFDIHVLKNNIYNTKEKNNGDTKRHPKQNVGFRY